METTLKGLWNQVTRKISIPHKLLIELDTVLAAEGAEFVLKRDGFVVVLLIADVLDDRIDVRFGDGETLVSGLPFELRVGASLIFYPIGRDAFRFFHKIGNSDGAREGCEEMHVVRDAPDFDRGASECFRGSTKVGVKLATEGFVLQKRLAIFR